MTDMEKKLHRAQHINRRMLDTIYEGQMKNPELSEEQRGELAELYRKSLDEFYDAEEANAEYFSERAELRGIRSGGIAGITGSIIGFFLGTYGIPFIIKLFHKKE